VAWIPPRGEDAPGEFLSRTIAISRNKATTFPLLLYARPVLNGKNGTGLCFKIRFPPPNTPAQSCVCVCLESRAEHWMLYCTYVYALQTLINILLCGSAEARSWALANLRCSRPILHNAARAQMPLEHTFGRLTFNLQSERAGLVVTFIKVQLLGSLQCDRLELHQVPV
jgi:hypothetical protein